MASSANEYHAVYAEYSRTLRTWFVTYGVSGPVVNIAFGCVIWYLASVAMLGELS
jgi:hypothetical protein